MQTILQILKQAGGWHHGLYLKIENPPYPALVIDAQDESGPMGLPALSVAQYSNALCLPEMHFELGLAGGAHLDPFYYRNDSDGVEQSSRYVYDGDFIYLLDVHTEQQRFARTWDNNLHLQGFAEAFERQQQTRRA